MLPNPWVILAVVVAFVAQGVYWHGKGVEHENTRMTAVIEKQRADAEAKARDQEQMWQGVVNGTVQNYDRKIAGIRRDYNAIIDGLSNRPGRTDLVSKAPGPACPCGTGETLCREDATFLAREFERADGLREALATCYQFVDQVK